MRASRVTVGAVLGSGPVPLGLGSEDTEAVLVGLDGPPMPPPPTLGRGGGDNEGKSGSSDRDGDAGVDGVWDGDVKSED